MNKADVMYLVSMLMMCVTFGAACKYDHPVAGGVVFFLWLLALTYKVQ